MTPNRNDEVSATRWFKIEPTFYQYGSKDVPSGLDVSKMLKKKPENPDGLYVQVTFRVPKAIFSPLAKVEIELDANNIFGGTPQVIAADLHKLKNELQP